MLTDEEIRKAFCATNKTEPLANGWEGLEPFAREVERLATEGAARACDNMADKFASQADAAEDDGDSIELKAKAWQCLVLGAEIRSLVYNA